MKAFKMATEKEIEDSILQYLKVVGPKMGFYYWKQHTVGVFDPVKQRFRKSRNEFVINGVSDIIMCWNGRIVCLEVKTQRGTLRESQKQFRDNIQQANGIYRIIRSLDEARRVLFEIKNIVQGTDPRVGKHIAKDAQ